MDIMNADTIHRERTEGAKDTGLARPVITRDDARLVRWVAQAHVWSAPIKVRRSSVSLCEIERGR